MNRETKRIAGFIVLHTIGVLLYVALFYGTFLITTYLLKMSLGIYDIEDSIQKIEKRIENM
jgi:hypothetical protein